ncbi:MAG: type II toxin-antitoxin system VapC family toxin [Opitutales bacterium]
MILLDTNVFIYAFDPTSDFFEWARGTLRDAIRAGRASANPVILAELCVGDASPETVATRLTNMGVAFLNLKPEFAPRCATAFAAYLQARKNAGEPAKTRTPLPDFFIGAHAACLKLPIATVDTARYSTYFPEVELITPDFQEKT